MDGMITLVNKLLHLNLRGIFQWVNSMSWAQFAARRGIFSDHNPQLTGWYL
jgi:hypothetical protein